MDYSLTEYKAFLALCMKVSTAKLDEARLIITCTPIEEDYVYFTEKNILELLLVITPNTVDPNELKFIKGIICGNFKRLQQRVEDIICKTDIYKIEDRRHLERHCSSVVKFINSESIKYKFNSEHDTLFSFVKSRTLKVSEFHSENLFFNKPLFELLPADDYQRFNDWSNGILKPLTFSINYYKKRGVPPMPSLLSFEDNAKEEEYFKYIIRFIDPENIDEFLINSIIPYVQFNCLWNLLNDWLLDLDFNELNTYVLILKVFEFFFNNYLVTQNQNNIVLSFLNEFINNYLFKLYSIPFSFEDCLSIISESIQYCIMNREYFSKFDHLEIQPDFTTDFDESVIDDNYIRSHFCQNSVSHLKNASQLVDSVNSLIKITNNNESMLTITQILLISISSSETQMNFAKLLIHNFKVNDTGSNKPTSFNNWESFLTNFHWLLNNSTVFHKIQNEICIEELNEILFDVLMDLDFITLTKKYLIINFNKNRKLQVILLKNCWKHFLKANNFNLEKGEMLSIVELLKNFDLQFEKEIHNANNFFVENRNIDIFDPKNDTKYLDFDSTLVEGKTLRDFANDIEILVEPKEYNKDFSKCENLNFEILKFRKLIISLNQLIVNYRFYLSYNIPVKPIDIFVLNNPLIILDKVLELNSKSYNDMSKIYKILVDFCIALDDIELIFDVTKFDDSEVYEKATPYNLKDKVITSCINAALIDLNFDFAYENSMRLLRNETGTSVESLDHIWLTIFQVCKFINPIWMSNIEEFLTEDDDGIQIPLDTMKKQIELISTLLEVIPKSFSLNATENKIILKQANYLTNKYHYKINKEVIDDFNNYQYKRDNSLFSTFNTSTSTLLNQFTKNDNSKRFQDTKVNSLGGSPVSMMNSPRNSQLESMTHTPISMGRRSSGGGGVSGGRLFKAIASSAAEFVKTEGSQENLNQEGQNQEGGSEMAKNLLVSTLGWAIGATSGDMNLK